MVERAEKFIFSGDFFMLKYYIEIKYRLCGIMAEVTTCPENKLTKGLEIISTIRAAIGIIAEFILEK